MGKRSREKRERREKGEIQPKKEKKDSIISILVEIIRWATYLSLFTPLIISGEYFFPFVGPKSIFFMGLAEIIFFTWIFLIILNPKYRPRFNILLVSLILFLIVLILATIFGADISRSFWSKYERMTGLLMWFHLFVFFLVISSTFRDESDWFKFFEVSISAAILMSLISLFVKANPNAAGMLTGSRGGATIGNSSFMGTYLLFNIFLAIYLIFETSGGLRIYSGISFLIISIALFLSGARAATLSFFGGLVLLFLLWLIFSKKGFLKFASIFLLLIYAIGVFGLMYLSLKPGSFVYQKFVQMASKSRLVIWQIAWKGFLDRPWLGWGPENFELAFNKYFDPRLFLSEYGGEIWFDRAHNIIFDTLVATGILGMIFYLGIFIVSFYILLKKFFQQKIDSLTLSSFSVIFVSYFVQNLTVFDMINSYLMFFLILGFIGSIAVSPEGEPPFQNRPASIPLYKKVVLTLISILFILSFSKFVIQPLKADAYVIQAMQTPNLDQRVAIYKKTLETSALGKYQIRDFFADFTIHYYQNKRTSQENIKKEMDFVIEELKKSIKESPLDYKSYLTLSRVLNTYIPLDPTKMFEAEEILNKAIEISPKNPQGYWFLAQTKLYQNKQKEALSLAEKAIELEPRIKQSHLVAIEIAKIMGDEDLAKKKIDEAIKINPDWTPELQNALGT